MAQQHVEAPETPTPDPQTALLVDELPDTPVVDIPAVEEPASPETPASEPETPPESATPEEEAPTPEPEPQAPPTPDPATIERERVLAEREQVVERQQAEAQRQQQVAQVDSSVAAYRAQLEAAGLPATEVQRFVERDRALQMQVIQAQTFAQQESQVLRGQFNAALFYSNQYSIPFNDIAQMATPGEMESAGKAFADKQGMQARIDKLEASASEKLQATVPADQTFADAPGGGDEMTDEQVVALSGDPSSNFNDLKRAHEAGARLGYWEL